MKYIITILLISLQFGMHAQLQTMYITPSISGNNIPDSSLPDFEYDTWIAMEGLSVSNERFANDEANYYPPTKQIVFKTEKGMRELHPKQVASVTIGTDTYRAFPYIDKKGNPNFGFFPTLVNGEISLVKQIELREKRKRNTLMAEPVTKEKQYIELDRYYVSTQGKELIKIKPKKKTVAALFSKNEKKILSYIKRYKLKMRKEEDLIRAIEYGNSLTDSNQGKGK